MRRIATPHIVATLLAAAVCAAAQVRADTAATLSLYHGAATNPDPAIRAQAIYSIGKLAEDGRPGVPDLVAALDDSDPDVRYEAARALGRVKTTSAQAIARLARALEDKSGDVRITAMDALAAIGKPAQSSAPALIGILKSGTQYDQQHALGALSAVEADMTPAFPSLLAIAQSDRNDNLRVSALECIQKSDFDPQRRKLLRPAVLDALKSRTPNVRTAAIGAMLGTLLSEDDLHNLVHSLLVHLINDPDEDVRSALVQKFSFDGSTDMRDMLRIAATDSSAEVRRYAISTLARGSVEDLGLVIPALKDPASKVRSESLQALSALGHGSPSSCKQAAPLAGDQDEDVRVNTTKLLGSCNSGPQVAFDALRKSSLDASSTVRQQAISSIGNLASSSRGRPESLGVAASANLILGEKKPREEAVASVLTAMKDPESNVREAAATALLELAPLSLASMPEIASAAESDDSHVRIAALRALATFGHEARSSAPLVGKILKTDTFGTEAETALVHGTAAETLGLIAGDEGAAVVPTLQASLHKWSHDSTEANVLTMRALANTGNAAASAIPALVERLSDGEYKEQEAALITLTYLGPPAHAAVEAAVAQQRKANDERARKGPAKGMALMASIGPTVHLDAASRLEEYQASGEISLLGQNGEKEQVVLGPRSVLIGVATWCPHSKALLDFLASDDVKRMTVGWQFNFVFGNEFPYIEKVFEGDVKRGEMTEAERADKLAYLRARTGALTVYDPAVLARVPGRVLFAPPESPQYIPESFPSVFSIAKRSYKRDAVHTWSDEVLGIPEWRTAQVSW
jgi:HEAT repeat protein